MSEFLFTERVVVCPKCEGDGKIESRPTKLVWRIRSTIVQTCWRCHGEGYVIRQEDAA